MASLLQVWQRCKTFIVGVLLIIWSCRPVTSKCFLWDTCCWFELQWARWWSCSRQINHLPQVRTWGARARLLSYQEADQFVLDLHYGVRLPLWPVEFIPPKNRKGQMWCLCIIWVTFNRTLNATRCSLTTILSSSVNRSLTLTPLCKWEGTATG